ncbi:putative NGG1 interacting factor 3-like [Trypanosoma vivax]|uniref:Putative NGG1 interacting factor 3-like n=1 Tax=Trypanosoma vivax (strain Y486) TaxID=1055687 RepID=G0UBR7_TRYVY|nr:putative NGG1 interacting factor 3-like [Trypanosoma vivax]CCC53265.1 putative NGG1 interacting factor 3-like [Trypanosoma vivax Y486]
MASLIRRVAKAMCEIAPLQLADSSWDNVGVLVESPEPNGSNVVVLTIDLTPRVMEECISNEAEVIVAYHPPIFTPMKRLTLDDPKQKIILQTVRCGASIFSPHTSLDAAKGGVNDWLASIVDKDGGVCPIQPCDWVEKLDSSGGSAREVGMGRVVSLSKCKTIEALVARVKKELNLPTVRVSLPNNWDKNTQVKSVAVCAGSGAGVFKKLKQQVDVLLCGEMGHHDVLAANACGRAVILCEHTNTERGYLRHSLQPLLQKKLGEGVRVVVSTSDEDPLVVW